MAFLLNQECFLVSPEVPLGRWGQATMDEASRNRVIDVCGVSDIFSPYDTYHPGDSDHESHCVLECKRNVLRGVEVKVSRSDFRSGFMASGCNFNYLLAPMRLVATHEVPRGVGLIEYNKHKFGCNLSPDGIFRFDGLRIVKRPEFRKVPQNQIDNATAWIARRSLRQQIDSIFKQFTVKDVEDESKSSILSDTKSNGGEIIVLPQLK